MGRFTSGQIYGDRNTKTVKVDAVEAGDARSRGGSVAAFARSETEAFLPGSSAGAHSGEFHLYRQSRYRELNRIELQEQLKQRKEDSEALAYRVAFNKREAEAKSASNATKRKKRKAQQQQNKEMAKQLKAAAVSDKCEGEGD